MRDARLPHHDTNPTATRQRPSRPQCSSPPPYYNFHKAPVVTAGPYDGYENLMYDEKIGGYVPRKEKSA